MYILKYIERKHTEVRLSVAKVYLRPIFRAYYMQHLHLMNLLWFFNQSFWLPSFLSVYDCECLTYGQFRYVCNLISYLTDNRDPTEYMNVFFFM